jgi:hypothetical protein
MPHAENGVRGKGGGSCPRLSTEEAGARSALNGEVLNNYAAI